LNLTTQNTHNMTTTTNFYVCSKYGCIWMGLESEMRQDYSYGPDLWIIPSQEEAEAKLIELQDESLAAV